MFHVLSQCLIAESFKHRLILIWRLYLSFVKPASFFLDSSSGFLSLFGIESPSGRITLQQPGLDYEQYTNYTVTVNSTDSGFPPYTVTGSFEISVKSINENPERIYLDKHNVCIVSIFLDTEFISIRRNSLVSYKTCIWLTPGVDRGIFPSGLLTTGVSVARWIVGYILCSDATFIYYKDTYRTNLKLFYGKY